MTTLAWQTVRARAGGFVGTFIALALGVALLSVMALTLASTAGAGDGPPRWYIDAPVVVSGADSITVTTGSGEDRETDTTRTARHQAVPADLPARLTAAGLTVVVDHAGHAMADGAPGDTVHPWSAAALHPYTWVAGGAPAGPGDIVLTAPTAHRPGETITVQTVRGPEQFTVSGVVGTDAPAALYTVDAVAAERAGGRIEAIAVFGGSPKQVRQVTGVKVRVLTGDARRRAEPRPDADQLAVAASLLGTTSGLAGFVSIFVVAGTFAYAVAARRREFGLLRAAGATPRQVRRLVLGEALVVGVLASVSGAALGAAAAPAFAHWLARSGFAPENFTARFIMWPVLSAIGAGMLVTLLGVWLAARRASKVRPIEALRDAAVDRRAMTLTRWIVGVLALGGSVPMVALVTTVPPDEAIALVLNASMLLIIACAMFAPLLIPPLVWLLTTPLAPLRGAIGMLARHGARAAVRRTAATAGPILVTVGISAATLAATGTLISAVRGAAHDRVTVGSVAVPAGGPGIADATVTALRGVPGVTTAVPVRDDTVYRRIDGTAEEWSARYANGPDLAGVLNLPVVAGSLADLTGTGTVAVPESAGKLGAPFDLWLDDGTAVHLRVVAVFAEQLDLVGTVLLPWDLRPEPLATAVYLRAGPQALPAAEDVAGGAGASIVSTRDLLSASEVEQDRINRLALIAVLGLALAYTGISIANTLVMATNDRARDLATLRLAGATPGQVLRMIAVEAVLVTGIGVILASAVATATVAGVLRTVGQLSSSTQVVVPWGTVGAIALACLVTAVAASVIPAALLLRRRPVELAGVPE